MDKKSLKVKIFLNFYGTYIKLSNVAELYTTHTICTSSFNLRISAKLKSKKVDTSNASGAEVECEKSFL